MWDKTREDDNPIYPVPHRGGTPTDPPQLVIFTVNDYRYALPLGQIERVVPIVEIIPLPQAPLGVSGIINFHGQVIPVFDLRPRFDLPAREVVLTDQLIITKTSRRLVALWVDKVVALSAHIEEAVVLPEAILPDLTQPAGVIKSPSGLILICDLDRFLSLAETAALDQAIEDSQRTK